MWEKRQLKAMGKLRKDLLKTLQSLQLHYDIKDNMHDDLEEYRQNTADRPAISAPASQEFATSFTDFATRVVIEPFGGRLFQPVHDLASELELPEELMEAL